MRKLAYAALAGLLMGTTPAFAQTGWSLAANTSANDGDNCDTSVAQQITNEQALQVDAAGQLANLMHSSLPSGGIGSLSCLDNLLRGLGLNNIFNPPSLSGIENWLGQQVCNEVNTLKSQGMSPITSIEGRLNSASNTSLGLGQIVPGVNLGAIPIGMQMTNGNGLNSNIGGYFSYGTPRPSSLFTGFLK